MANSNDFKIDDKVVRYGTLHGVIDKVIPYAKDTPYTHHITWEDGREDWYADKLFRKGEIKHQANTPTQSELEKSIMFHAEVSYTPFTTKDPDMEYIIKIPLKKLMSLIDKHNAHQQAQHEKELVEAQVELLEMASDTIFSYGYGRDDGKYFTGGYSAQEAAFEIMRKHNCLDSKGLFDPEKYNKIIATLTKTKGEQL